MDFDDFVSTFGIYALIAILVVVIFVIFFISLILTIIAVIFAIGAIVGIFYAFKAYISNFYTYIYKNNKLVACITALGIITMFACGAVLIEDDVKSMYNKISTLNLGNSNSNNKISSATPTPIPADTNAYVTDLTDPSKSITPIASDTGSCLYKTTLTFPAGYDTHKLEMKNVKPVAHIDLKYTAKDITRMKGYTDSATKRWVEEEISYPDPNACFEIIVYDSNGNIAYSTGYGMCEYDSYGTSKGGQIKIFNAGDYTVVMTGKSMEVGIEITEYDSGRNTGEN